MKKTFKLIDKEGYSRSSEGNLNCFYHFSTIEDEVTVEVSGNAGWVGNALIISEVEWEFFEEVKEIPQITEEEIKSKRKVDLTEKVFLAMLSNPKVVSIWTGEEILEIADQHAELFIGTVEGGDK